ncbi:hypothetical protein Tco_0186422 [Tanacetum coccineum]
MDETTVRGWLKEQQDRIETMAQQQAAVFQAQFKALRADLKSSLGQLQGCPGGHGDQGLLLPRSMRLDVPKFTGKDPERWSSHGVVLMDVQEWADHRLGAVRAFSLARVIEARLDDQASSMSVTATKAVTSSGGPRQTNPRFGLP